jgi:hypothetical protein
MTSVATTAPAGAFRKLTVRDAAVLLALSWLIPFVVHLVPWSGARPLGAYVLPAFWATFIAVYFFGAAAGLVTGLFMPAVNLLLTGLPAWRSFGSISLELVIFVLVTTWAVRQAPRVWLWAPLGYALAKTVTALTLATTATIGRPDAAGYFFTHLLVGNGAGLVALALINLVLVKFYPKGVREEG